MNYERRLLKAGYTTIIASLVVVALLMLPGRAGAAAPGLTVDYTAAPFIPAPIVPLGYVDAPAPGAFLDHILFSVATPFTVTLQNWFTDFSNISGLNATLYNLPPAGALYSGVPNNPVAGSSFANPVPSAVFGVGAYDLQISGTALLGGYYSGIINLSSTVGPPPPPIPEPETYAMMLAGLGLMGYVARRRKQKNDA